MLHASFLYPLVGRQKAGDVEGPSRTLGALDKHLYCAAGADSEF